jgi:hypothetical protein
MQRLEREMKDTSSDRHDNAWLTKELLMLLEDEDGEYIDLTPSIRSKVTYEQSVKVMSHTALCSFSSFIISSVMDPLNLCPKKSPW